jgi:hypothetical protein
MTSAGGLVPVDVAADVPVAIAVGGPAGGVRPRPRSAAACGFPDAVSFDMGGRAPCLPDRGGVPEPAPMHGRGAPGAVPPLDIHTIGAGGGSDRPARCPPALVVGPERRVRCRARRVTAWVGPRPRSPARISCSHVFRPGRRFPVWVRWISMRQRSMVRTSRPKASSGGRRGDGARGPGRDGRGGGGARARSWPFGGAGPLH